MNIDLISREDIGFYVALLVAIATVFGILLQLWSYWRSRMRRLSITSYATLVESKPAVVVKVTNVGQPPIVVEKVAFSLHVWDDGPSLRVPSALKALRAMEI
jgi:hypothetical protein